MATLVSFFNFFRGAAAYRCAMIVGVAAFLLASGSGCVSTKYRKAPKNVPPPVALNFSAADASVGMTLHTVIVQKGPGSWKREAYWDEYVCSITNESTVPITIEAAALVDVLDAEQSPGVKPWALEKQSRENLKKFAHSGRKIVIGAGLTLTWFSTPGLVFASAAGGSMTGIYLGLATFVAIPTWAIGSGVRTLVARYDIQEEFNRRRIALPLTIAPGETKRGSFFFPISPGPQRLRLAARSELGLSGPTLDLAPLAGLHLLKQIVPVPEAKP